MSARNVVVIGTQWGDEGKGKIVDWLTDAPGAWCASGGHNAGHTLVHRRPRRPCCTSSPRASCAAACIAISQWRGALAAGAGAGMDELEAAGVAVAPKLSISKPAR